MSGQRQATSRPGDGDGGGPGNRRRLADWALVAAATVGGGWLAGRAGLPSGYLFAAMLAGLGYALAAPGRLALPAIGFRAGQAVTGVAIGTFLHSSTLTGLGTRWVPVVLVSVATLAVTIGVGLLLGRVTQLDRPTASLGMVAGGAAGIVAMADELGGDDRLVAFMQYLRVLVVTLLTPLLVPIALRHPFARGRWGWRSAARHPRWLGADRRRGDRRRPHWTAAAAARPGATRPADPHGGAFARGPDRRCPGAAARPRIGLRADRAADRPRLRPR
ncbi:MAG TPA: AbrB family transcriptional regulator, partial [Thermoleophilaceae bacterium]|nr:AbrB family transcriptional regulator [Thermoleophilaceae bacterium]